MLKSLEALEILTRLSEKGILGKSILKEINNDIKYFIEEENTKDNSEL